MVTKIPGNAKPPGAATRVSAFPLRTHAPVIPGALSAQTVGIGVGTVNALSHLHVDVTVEDPGMSVDEMWTMTAVAGDGVCTAARHLCDGCR